MKKILTYALFLAILFTMGQNIAFAETVGAKITTNIDKESFLDPDYLENSIEIESATSTYNAVFLSIMFDQEYLQLEEIQKNDDFCQMTIHSGHDNTIGYAFLICGNPGGNASSTMDIADLRFRKLKEGQAKINLLNSQIISNDGQARNILEQGDIHSVEVVRF